MRGRISTLAEPQARSAVWKQNLILGPALLMLVTVACADSSTTTLAPEPVETTPTETTSSFPAVTDAAATTTLAPTTTTTTLPLTTTTEEPTAAGDLVAFFAAAEELDAEIAATADEFNADFDADAGTLDRAAAEAIAGLSTERIAGLIPAGMDLELETAVLAVYTDLESRIAALDGAARYVDLEVDPHVMLDVEYALQCLGGGGESKARFASDLAAARELAGQSAPSPAVAPDSSEAGILAVRLDAIFLFNYGCDSCGGAVYEEPLPVDWEGRTVGDGVGFEAEFDGTQWQIMINAC